MDATMPSDPKSSDGKHSKATVSHMDKYHGSKVFEQAALTIGVDEFVARKVIWEAASAALMDSWRLTIDELGVLLPEIERRLRLLAPPEEAGVAFAKLRSFVLSWEE
jgi:hypothetical protein